MSTCKPASRIILSLFAIDKVSCSKWVIFGGGGGDRRQFCGLGGNELLWVPE